MLLAAALGVRIHGVDNALVSFDESRQVHNAIATRAIFYGWVKSNLNPLLHSAERAAARRPLAEPSVFSGLVAIAYVFGNGEDMVVPRIVGTLFWTLAGLFLFALASYMFSAGTALVAVAYFLLLPYTVVVSQAFQPDALMLMLMIASWYAIVRNDFAPSLGGTAIAGLVSGLAILVQPICAPSILVLYVLISLRGMGVRGFIFNVESWAMAVLALAPSAGYYLPELFRSGQLQALFAKRYQPELWQTPEFWLSWRDMLFALVHGPYVAGVAVLGILLAPSSRSRIVLISLVFGYLVYGLLFSSHGDAHAYDQLQVLPIVGLALASFVRRLWLLSPRMLRPVVGLSLLAGAVALGYWDANEIQANAWPRTHGLTIGDPYYREIGDAVRHSAKVVFIDANAEGGPLEFYGQLSGWRWPSEEDPSRQWQAEIESLIQNEGAEYFVSTPSEDLLKHPDLARYLAEHYPQISKSSQYLVYDLRPNS